MKRRVFLGLGANVGDREANLREAIARLKRAPGVNFLRQSRVYQTAPVGVTDQPEFLNMVVEVEVADNVTARELLTSVKQIEAEVGRKQRERWGPREIDIDVLLFGDERIVEDDFEVPHPRMWERAFVMAPLAELEPGMKTPSGEMVREAAERLEREQGIELLDDGDGIGNGGEPGKRWWHRVWDRLPIAVLIAAALWCVGVPLVEGLMGPYSRGLSQVILLLLVAAALIWAACVLITVVMLVVHWIGGRPGARRTARRLMVLAASAALFWAWGPPFGFYLQWKLKEYGLRRAVTARVSVSDLREAAVTMLDDPRWRGRWRRVYGRDAIGRSPGMPKTIIRLKPDRVTVFPGTAQGMGHIELTWNPDWNIEVGPPGFHAETGSRNRWADGVYGLIAMVE